MIIYTTVNCKECFSIVCIACVSKPFAKVRKDIIIHNSKQGREGGSSIFLHGVVWGLNLLNPIKAGDSESMYSLGGVPRPPF